MKKSFDFGLDELDSIPMTVGQYKNQSFHDVLDASGMNVLDVVFYTGIPIELLSNWDLGYEETPEYVISLLKIALGLQRQPIRYKGDEERKER